MSKNQTTRVSYATGALLAAALTASSFSSSAGAAVISWNTTDGNWDTPANWVGVSVPIANSDVRIGNTVAAENGTVQLGSNTPIASLAATDGMVVRAIPHRLNVAGSVTLDGLNAVGNSFHPSALVVGGGAPNAPAFRAAEVAVLNGARLGLEDDAAARISNRLTIDERSSLELNGELRLTGAGTVLRNDGRISAHGFAHLQALGGGLLDLDGTLGNGRIVTNHDMMISAGGLTDAFDGTITLNGHTFRMDIDGGWTLGTRGRLNIFNAHMGVGAGVFGSEIEVRGTIYSSSSLGEVSADVVIKPSAVIEVDTGTSMRFTRRTVVEGGQFTVDGIGLFFTDSNEVQLRGGNFDAAPGSAVSFLTDTQFAGDINFTGNTRFNNGVTTLLDSTINGENIYAGPTLSLGDWDLPRDLTINADRFGSQDNVFDPNLRISRNLLNPATLEVNLSGDQQWTLAGDLEINTFGGSVSTTSLRGSDVAISGDVMIEGSTRFEARVDFLGNAIDFDNGSLLLTGGDLNNPNTMDAAGFTGDGAIKAAAGIALEGTGDILSIDVDFAPGSSLTAVGTENGPRLVISSAIVSMGTLGTRGDDAKLMLLSSYDTAVGEHFVMDGGLVTGFEIINTNEARIRGHGTLAIGVDNQTVIAAEGGRLIIDNEHPEQVPGFQFSIQNAPVAIAFDSNTDFDGTNNDGTLLAIDGSLTIANAPVTHFGANGGTVRVAGPHELHLDNTRFYFSNGSKVQLFGGSIRSHNQQVFQGQLISDAASSKLDAPVRFEAGSLVDLQADLVGHHLVEVVADADFGGPGTFSNATTGDLLLFDGAEMGVDVASFGQMRVGNPVLDNSVGTALIVGDLFLAGRLEIDLSGDAPGLYDLLSIDETLTVRDAVFDVALINSFEPEAGDAFNILDFTRFEDLGYTLKLPDLNPGLVWDSSLLEIDGVIRVTVPEPVSAVMLALAALLMLRRRR